MNNVIQKIKAIWANPAIKTGVYAALGASGGIYSAGVGFIFTAATIKASIVGALVALAALYTQHPLTPIAPKQ